MTQPPPDSSQPPFDPQFPPAQPPQIPTGPYAAPPPQIPTGPYAAPPAAGYGAPPRGPYPGVGQPPSKTSTGKIIAIVVAVVVGLTALSFIIFAGLCFGMFSLAG
jgi:hypothetical protein